MLLVNLSDGVTLRVDLEDQREADSFRARLYNREFSRTIRGISILCGSQTYAVPHPSGPFDRIRWEVDLTLHKGEVSREQVICYADHVKITLTVYRNSSPAMSKVELSRPGRLAVRPMRSR